MTLAPTDRQANDPTNSGILAADPQRDAHTAPPLTMKLSGQLPGRSRSLPPQAAKALDPDLQEQLTALYQHGQYQQAAARCAELLNTHRKSAFLWELLGRCHLAQNALDEAATCLNKACELQPTSATTFAAMGDVYKRQNRGQDALALYKKALSLDPACLPALNNMGNTLLEQDKIIEADECFAKAIEQAPDNAQLLYNRANIQRQLGNVDVACKLYEQAARYAPNFLEARYNLAQMAGQAGRQAEAIHHLEQILVARPADDRARARKLRLMAELCDWRWIDEYQAHRRNLGLRGSACAPQALIGLEDNPDLLRIRMQAHAHAAPTAEPVHLAAATDSRPVQLRIGYFVSSARDRDALDRLDTLLAQHDTSRFALYAYVAGPAREGCAHVHHRDLRGLAASTIRTQAQADKLDIAIDLTSFTEEVETQVFGARIAPVQIALPGFPGTMGTLAYDYLLTDAVTCPPGSERYFEEHLIRMPHSYHGSIEAPDLSGHQFSRRDCGLPDDGFVFCTLAPSHAVTPREYDIWMRLLTKVDDSVLWMPAYPTKAQVALRKEAEARGVSPERLIFGPACDGSERMARAKVADLFLDTFTLNAGPTAREALIAGLPVLSMAGRQFAARTTASLLTAAGLGELLTTSEKTYEARALELAEDRDQLMTLRSKLRLMQAKAPLFDNSRYARDLERGFEMAFARCLESLPPQHMTVPANTAPDPVIPAEFAPVRAASGPIHAA